MSSDRSYLNFLTIIMPNTSETWPGHDHVAKMYSMISESICKIEDFLVDRNGEDENVELGQSLIYSEKALKRHNMNVQIYVIIDDYVKTTGSNNGLNIHLSVARKDIDLLPLGDNNEYTPTESKMYAHFMLVILHELCHAFGAFHANRGLMSGVVPLSDNFELQDILDDHSALIVSETLHKHMDEDNYCHVAYQFKSNSIVLDCLSGIRGVFFLKQNKYTDLFFHLDYITCFSMVAPDADLWDAVFVVSTYGTSKYIRKEALDESKEYSRFHSY